MSSPADPTTEEVVHLLVAEVPALATTYAAHVEQHGILRPDVFLTEVMAWTVDDFENDMRGRGRRPGWRAIIQFLDQQCALGGDGPVSALIRESFTANAPELGTRGDQLNFLFGEHLKPDYQDFITDYINDPSQGIHQEQIDLIDELVARFPVLREQYDENLSDDGVILDHPFFGDLTRWVVEDFEADRLGTHAPQGWRQVLDLLETWYAWDPGGPAAELIHVSFVENLPFPWEPGGAILDELGPHLQRALKVVQLAGELARLISKAVPELRPIYERRFVNHEPPDEEHTPVEFLAEATRWACQDFETVPRNSGGSPGWRILLDLLEDEYTEDGFRETYGPADGFIADAIELGFLERLPSPGDPAYGIREHLGPHLRAGLERLYMPRE